MSLFGGMHTMWLIVLFDLPTETPQMRRAYTQFRKSLLTDGFTMMQYSVYIRHSASEENAQMHAKRVKARLPPQGEVRLMRITDKQFGKIEVFYGKNHQPIEKAPEQMELF